MVQIQVSEVAKPPLDSEPVSLSQVTSTTPSVGPQLRTVRLVRKKER